MNATQIGEVATFALAGLGAARLLRLGYLAVRSSLVTLGRALVRLDVAPESPRAPTPNRKRQAPAPRSIMQSALDDDSVREMPGVIS